MIIDKPTKKQSVSEEAKSGQRTTPVKLVEMGPVSVETKGIVRGFELGFTPKS
jgi:hypothetical protein